MLNTGLMQASASVVTFMSRRSDVCLWLWFDWLRVLRGHQILLETYLTSRCPGCSTYNSGSHLLVPMRVWCGLLDDNVSLSLLGTSLMALEMLTSSDEKFIFATTMLHNKWLASQSKVRSWQQVGLVDYKDANKNRWSNKLVACISICLVVMYGYSSS